MSRSLGWRETLAVIGIVAVVGVLGYLGYQAIADRILQARVEAALPQISSEIREQRKLLTESIEAYRAHFGFYPPDNVFNGVADPVTNSLLYELSGTIHNREKKRFELERYTPMEEADLRQYFHRDAFTNVTATRDPARHFLKIEPVPTRELREDPDIFALGYSASESIPNEVLWDLETTPWRYVSSSPTNNPGKFDLWMEVQSRKRKIVIGNWKSVE